jgi:hypothetical protein
MKIATSHGYDPSDARLAQTIASMLIILRLSWGEDGAPQATLDAIDVAHEAALRQALAGASAQIDSLCRLLLDIRTFLCRLNTSRSRFVLIEMPTGNSVAVKLLARLLEECGGGAAVEIVRAALARKTLKEGSVTRRQLLDEHLKAAKLTKNDILVYLDEWETGSNFKAISEYLKKLVPQGCFLFAAAYMTDKSSPHPRYKSFCDHHDALMQAWRVQGTEFRRLLPPLESSLGGGYFFWSEHDRTAGYRKMQLHGSAFSSIDDAVQKLNVDSEALKASTQILLGELAAENDLPGTPGQGIRATMELFEASYQDYLQCRDELRQIADDMARGGQLDDFDAGMEPILQRYYGLLNDRKAKLAICLASVYMGRIGSLDPAKRYYFDDQAPVIIELAGPALNTHQIVMEEMKTHLDALDNSKRI